MESFTALDGLEKLAKINFNTLVASPGISIIGMALLAVLVKWLDKS